MKKKWGEKKKGDPSTEWDGGVQGEKVTKKFFFIYLSFEGESLN